MRRGRTDEPEAISSSTEALEPTDARLAACALTAWLTCVLALGLPPWVGLTSGSVLVLVGLLVLSRWDPRLVAVLLAAAVALLVAGLRLTTADAGPVPELADAGAVVDVDLVLTTDPLVIEGTFADLVVFDARIDEVTARGVTTRVRSPVVVFAEPGWERHELGSTLEVVGRLDVADDAADSAVLLPSRLEGRGADPPWWWDLSGSLRDGITEGVTEGGKDERALVPALVDGDDHAISEEVDEAFRTSGLTHLLAVSGTNLTLMLAFVLAITRRMGVRGSAELLVGVLATIGFVLLARPEPSVLRAAAMGLVAIVGLGAGGRRRGVRALSVAVLVLVLLDPWLARSPGFALSAMATGGILVLAPPWRDALAHWMPTWLAEAIAVPLAAQLACTPVVAVLSGEVSLVAVVANMLVAPVIAPVTVLGLVAGLVALVWVVPAHLIGVGACAVAWWIITVARHSAAMPGAVLDWGTTSWSIVALVALCVVLAAILHRVLARRWVTLACTALMLAWLAVPVRPGWPPHGWVLVMCDVGQGDGVVLRAGDGLAVVVDVGPDPPLIDRCLSRLGVNRVALVILTHPHADHIGGLAGVSSGRRVDIVAIGPGASGDPAMADVLRWADAADADVQELSYATTQRLGDLSWTVLGPLPGFETDPAAPEPSEDAEGAESGDVNDTSVVLRADVRGVSMLLTGDIEPTAQQALRAWGPALAVDVLKVPHHGSRHQDADFLRDAEAELAVISAGEDNAYGHPAIETLHLLEDSGTPVLRTDLLGDVAVVVNESGALGYVGS